MVRKSMGSFIAALRKANGMTQADLADKLSVMDKTVSRWEREKGHRIFLDSYNRPYFANKR